MDNERWTVNYLFLWIFLLGLYIPHAVTLQTATLAGNTLNAMAAGDVARLHQYKLCIFCVVLFYTN